MKRFFKQKASAKPNMRHRSAGDAARDVRDWAVAEREYAAHLELFPQDQAIWVQYGHSLKEQEKLDQAEAAYRRAVDMQPDDADAQLHHGHALKLLGMPEEAERAYGLSFELKPSKAALDEVAESEPADHVRQIARRVVLHDTRKTIYFEIDDLFDYLRSHATVSGIQRVQVGIIQYAVSLGDEGNTRYALIRTGKHASVFWELEPADVQAVLRLLTQPKVSLERLRSLIETAEQRAAVVEPSKGHVYVVLGAFWGFGSNAARYARLKAAGVAVGVYIYDLIPITHPEYCVSQLCTEFTFALGDGLHSFDFIFTISRFVADSVKSYLKKHGLRERPIEPILLSHEFHRGETNLGSWSGQIAKLRDRDFVLMVSTIEPRKNHVYLYNIWKTLIEEGLEMPDLVFVGRFGWRVNDFRDVLEGTDYLGGRIHVLHDLSDTDLALLYKSCIFTAFPSIVEGWGLPVGESLAYGRPCIASKTSSVPEVGGDLVDYIDPWDLNDGLRVFRRMIFDRAFREARTQEIARSFSPRTWSDVGKDMLTRLENIRGLEQGLYRPPLLAAGEMLIPGQLSISRRVPENYVRRPLRAIIAEGFYPPEPFGAWLRGTSGSLWFATDCEPGTSIVVYLLLQGAPWVSDHVIDLTCGRNVAHGRRAPTFPESAEIPDGDIPLDPSRPKMCRIFGQVDQDRTILINLKIKGQAVGRHPNKSADDDRIFYVGMIKLSYAPANDHGLRVGVAERFAFAD